MEVEETRRAALGGHSLAYAEHGAGTPTFLCLHGLVDRRGIWSRMLAPLASRGRVLCLDQRGHGGSDSPPGPYAREDLAGDAVALLDVVGCERAVLVGHSMGGIVAMATALAHPTRVAGLVLLGTASQCSEKVAGWYERIARAGETDGLPGLAARIYGPDTDKRIEGDAQGIAHVTRMLKSLHTQPLTPRLVEIACPVLLLVGERDPMGPKASRIIHDALPAGRGHLEVVPGSGHWLQLEAPDVVMRAVDTWLPGLAD